MIEEPNVADIYDYLLLFLHCHLSVHHHIYLRHLRYYHYKLYRETPSVF
jgi:hypothetical protein